MKNRQVIFFTTKALVCFLLLFPLNTIFSQSANSRIRTFNELFPNLSWQYRAEVFGDGVIRTMARGESLELLPAASSGIDLPERISAKSYPFLAESLVVVPYKNTPWRILDAYNALGRVRDLKGRLYNSHTRGQAVPLFEDASRMESSTRNNPIPDPPPASFVPASETMYIRLKDVNFGNTYYRGDITPVSNGLFCSLTNYRTITYLIFTVMKAENFSAYLYVEPIAEGMLIYSVAGTDVSNFIASQIDIPSAISKRLAVFIGWVSDGLQSM